MAICSFSTFGYDGSLVNVEVDLRKSIPAVDIIGLADGAVTSHRERVRSAIINSGLEFPQERVLISLSPADLYKDGAAFDLAVALAILTDGKDTENVIAMGELALDGSVRPVRGVYPALMSAIGNGIKYAVIPENSEAVPDGITVLRVRTLREAYDAVMSGHYGEGTNNGFGGRDDNDEIKVEFGDIPEGESLDGIKGNEWLKFAMAVAAAGRHSLLAYGAPGCGKTTVLRRMPQLMPKLLDRERDSVQKIYSVAGLLRDGERVEERPFRMPHPTASLEGMCGGGVHCSPGEISLAHNGVLFLDEAAEFKTSVLQMLRVPLESNSLTLARAGRSTIFPARFQLVMAASPCPCGNYGSDDRLCLCSMKSIEMYWKKFGGPLLDRVAIRVNCSKREDGTDFHPVAMLREMIADAWRRQYKRQGKLTQDLDPGEVMSFIRLDSHAEKHWQRWTDGHGISVRAASNILKLARTVQDMKDDNSEVDDVSLGMVLMLHGTTVLEDIQG